MVCEFRTGRTGVIFAETWLLPSTEAMNEIRPAWAVLEKVIIEKNDTTKTALQARIRFEV